MGFSFTSNRRPPMGISSVWWPTQFLIGLGLGAEAKENISCSLWLVHFCCLFREAVGRSFDLTEEDWLGSSTEILCLAFLFNWPFLAVLAKWLNFVFLAGEPSWLSFIEEFELLLRALSSRGVYEVAAPSFMKLSKEFMRRE